MNNKSYSYFLKTHSLTWSKQRIGHFITHAKHCLHLRLFKVQVLLCRLTVIASTGQTNWHLPHSVHLWISFPTRQRDLWEVLKNSENKCIPNSKPIDERPPLCLKYNHLYLFWVIIILFKILYKYFGIPKFF